MASEDEGDRQNLRIVFLGVSGAGKSSIGNAILGPGAFKESRTRESEIQRGRVEDRNFSIIDTPGFFNTHLTDEEMKQQMMKSLDLTHPGPHVFLLIINLENFEEDERNIVEQIEEIFGSQVFKFTLVLFTGREQMSNKEWTVFMLSTKFQELVRHFRDNYHQINSTNQVNQTHITELLDKIDEFIKQNNHQYYNSRVFSVFRTKSIRIKKIQKEEKTYKRKERELKQKQAKTAYETFTTHSVVKERTHAVIEEVKEIMREKKQEEDEYTYVEIMQEQEARQEQTKIKSETFEMKNETEERKTNTVTETESFVSYFRQSMRYENLDTRSLDRFDDFSNEGMMPEKSRGTRNKKTYTIKPEDELRIVLLGKTGAGKSATGNTILRNKLFDEKLSPESVTKECQKVRHQNISVIDTPGLCDTSLSEEQLKEEIVKCVEMSVPGPHAFLLVIRLDDKFTMEQKKTVKWIQKNFGEEAARYTIVLFTRGDQLDKPIEEFLTKSKQINELVKQCKGGYHVFNNTDEENRSQVTELLEKIDQMVMKNGGEHYTNEMYKEAQRKIDEENEKIRQEERRRLLSKVALVGTGVAVCAGAVAGGAVSPAVISGAAAAGGTLASFARGSKTLIAAGNAALDSVNNGETLRSALFAAGNAALASALNGATLPEASTGGSRKK